jgi:hypothetical protein
VLHSKLDRLARLVLQELARGIVEAPSSAMSQTACANRGRGRATARGRNSSERRSTAAKASRPPVARHSRRYDADRYVHVLGKDAELAEAHTLLLIEQIEVEADRRRYRRVPPLVVLGLGVVERRQTAGRQSLACFGNGASQRLAELEHAVAQETVGELQELRLLVQPRGEPSQLAR